MTSCAPTANELVHHLDQPVQLARKSKYGYIQACLQILPPRRSVPWRCGQQHIAMPAEFALWLVVGSDPKYVHSTKRRQTFVDKGDQRTFT